MRLKQGLVLRHIGEDYMIVDPAQGTVDMTTVYTLNTVAAWLWQQLEGQDFTSEQMVELLTTRYEVGHRQAVQDVEKLLSELIRKGLIIE